MNGTGPAVLRLERLQRRALAVGVLLLALCVVAAPGNPRQFFQSYLQAYLFWIGISLGCLAIAMLHHLVGGSWGLPVRRLLEAGARTLPLMALLFLPILVGVRTLYEWARPEAVAANPVLQEKTLYLNVPGFVVRALVYFAIWIAVAHFLAKWSLEQDRTADPSFTGRLRALSAPGLLLYGLTVTFSAIDWGMSLEPEWHSTMYGMVFMASDGLQALGFVIVAAFLLARLGPLSDVASPPRFQDLGNLTLTFLMLWTYTAFCEFLIIWAENLTDEIPWYLHRTTGGWQGIAIALIVLQFALPFLLLLSRAIKRRGALLAAVGAGILVMRLVDYFWLVAPSFHPGVFTLHWMDVVAPLALGGLWIAVFVGRLRREALVPLHDPRLASAVERAGGMPA
jgi:hypothetical protein